jgi:hypothetical protein
MGNLITNEGVVMATMDVTTMTTCVINLLLREISHVGQAHGKITS